MSRRLPVVRPLSKSAWERVEARLLERLGKGEHLLLVSDVKPARHWPRLLPAVAISFAALIWWQRQTNVFLPTNAPLELGTAAAPAPRRTSHFVTTSVPTRTNLGEASVTLATHSEMSVVGSDDAGWHVNVERGQVDFDVAPRRGRPPFVVQAGETLVTVAGTRFTVARDGRRARVSVERGRVQIDSGAHRGSLGAGEQWPAPTSSAAPEALLRDAETLLAPRKEQRGTARQRSGHADRARQSFARATRIESRDPDSAVAIYRQLARGRGPWAANALYAEARLELERGHEAAARTRLARYLRSFPDGKNASDVRAILRQLTAGRGTD